MCEEISMSAATNDNMENSYYAIDWATAEQRVKEHKDYLMSAPQVMDPERLIFLNEIYDEYQGCSAFYIRAKLFERVLTKKKIFLDGNPLVGTLTGIKAGVYAYPEWNVAWIKDEMEMAKMSSLGEMTIPEETLSLLKSTYKRWKGKTCIDVSNSMMKEIYNINPVPMSKAGVWYDHASISSGSGMADYPLVLNKGIRAIINEVKQKLVSSTTTVDDKDKIEFYRALIVSLEAVISYAKRYSALALEEAEKENDAAKKAELLEIADVCSRVPEFPATNFREAIQSFWMTHVCLEIEQMACACSPGRYGQYMYPFYKKDIEEGKITQEQVKTLLKFQWIRHLELAEYQGSAYAMALSGHTGQTISIGGLDANGEDACTELEELMLEMQAELKNPQPTMSLFYHPKIKDSYMKKVVACIRAGGGQPQILNNSVVVERHLARFSGYEGGITIEDARNCGNIGCVTTGVCTKGSYIYQENPPCLAKHIELVLNNGKDPITKKMVGIETGDPTEFTSFDEFYDAYKKQLAYMFQVSMRHSDFGSMARINIVPSLFRSSLYDGCIEKGICEEAGGVRYPESLCIVTGGIDTVNSMLAIKHLVFDTKQVSMQTMLDALKADFEGYEEIQRLCFEAPKHGNDIDEIQNFVKEYYRMVDEVHVAQGLDFLGRKPLIDAYSLSYHNYFGALMGALPTGRNAGKALTDGSVSAMPGTDTEGITALVKSGAEAIDTVKYSSNHMNVKFTPSSLEEPHGTKMLTSIIKTYCDYGGSHIQFNSVSSETLKEAKKLPFEHKELVVRVAGFSAFFTRLDCGVQDEIIKRTEYKS